MTTYILLRDNKESTPLTITQLRSLGLRPTDLLWVEGQSVCWLHPGQIRELKDIGMPEEKLAETLIEEEVPATVNEKKVSTIDETKEQIKTISPSEFNKANPKISRENKKIFVALPQNEIKADKENSPENYQQKQQEQIQTEVPVAETKYSKPLNEIKELYLENLEKKNQQKNRWQIPPQLKRASVYFLLFLTGIAAGIVISRSLSEKQALAQSESPRTAGAENINQTDQATDYSAQYPENTGEETPADPASQQDNTKTGKTNPRLVNNPTGINETLSVDHNILPVPSPTDPVMEGEKTQEEVKEVRKPSIKELYSQISVKNNDYVVGSFGGIKNLELTLNNNSRFGLDEVEVQVQYLKPGDELIKTETVSFNNVGPGESKTIPVKKTNRGVKVSLKVSTIKSSDFQNNTARIE